MYGVSGFAESVDSPQCAPFVFEDVSSPYGLVGSVASSLPSSDGVFSPSMSSGYESMVSPLQSPQSVMSPGSPIEQFVAQFDPYFSQHYDRATILALNEVDAYFGTLMMKEEEAPVKTKKTRGMKKCLHVWEFLRDLCKSSKHYGHLVIWLDQKHGLFKILDPAGVANLWARKKNIRNAADNRSTMSFANFMRGVRYSRKEDGMFERVCDRGQRAAGYGWHGVKHVVKFGQPAADKCAWLRSFMIKH